MKKIGALFLCMFLLSPALAFWAVPAGAKQYAPLNPAFKTLSTGDKPLPPDFIKYKTRCWFNDQEVLTAENNPGPIGPAGLAIENRYAWAKFNDGSDKYCLMILVDAVDDSGGANNSLFIPKYGWAVVGRVGYNILIDWENPSNAEEEINLVFPVESQEMLVHKNSLKGISKSYKVDLPVSAYDDGSGRDCYYVPLYAILNEVRGGVMYNPFDDGAAFIFTGDALQGYSGVWETSDDTDERVEVDMGGKTVSVANYWQSLELRPDGTFVDINSSYDEPDWTRTESKGQYAFFGRILALRYTSNSEYQGTDFNNLSPVKVDAPHEGWGVSGGVGVYARYIEDWTPAEVLAIRNWRVLYSKKLSGRQW
jgi:hypothetical protein